MGNSLGAGVSALAEATDAVLIVLADQPFVHSETYEQLIDQYRQSDAQIVIPTYRGFRGNPVLLDRSVFPEMMALSGDVGCRAIFGDHSDGITKVAVDDVGILLDIDTKDDFEKLRKYRAGVEEIDHQFGAVDLSNRTLLENDASSHAKNKLVLVGSEPVVTALAKMARILQFRVTLLDPLLRASDLPEAHEVLNSLDLSHIPKGPDCYMVIASRGRFDEEAIEQALEADVGYIALVANRKRAAELRRRLEEKGQAPKKLARLRSPAGLDIGANTAEEIALSILAEIVYVSRKVGEDHLL
jgi:hypothetical protein